MSVNRYQPHVFILPEDDANRQLALGFLQKTASSHQIYLLPVAGGWSHVCDEFKSDHVTAMHRFDNRAMILLVDFDNDPNRLDRVQAVIPADLLDRVFVLGVRPEPEALKQAGLGSYEEIGKAMADDCHVGSQATWGHQLLSHNAGELDRLRRSPYHSVLHTSIGEQPG